MSPLEDQDNILAEAVRIGEAEPGGTLGTMHAEDGTPYLTYVFFHLRDDGLLLFGSMAGPQHARNIRATPEVSFLIDNREVIPAEWQRFDRVVIEGRAERVEKEDGRYAPFLAQLRDKNGLAARIVDDRGALFCIHPRRLILRRGIEPASHVVEFEGE